MNKHLSILASLICLNIQAQVKDTLKPQNLSVISVEKANILYRGINNPIKIAVPGAKSFTATAPGLAKIDNRGNYNFIVTAALEDSVVVKLDIILTDNTIKNEQKIFRIEDIPKYKAVLNGQNCTGCIVEVTKKQLIDGKIEIICDNSYLEKPVVKALEIKLPKCDGILIYGNQIDQETITKIRRLKAGSILYIKTYSKYHVIIENLKIKIIDEAK